MTSGRREHLAVFLREISAQLAQLSDAIGHLHFESGPPAVSIADLALIELMEARA